MNAYEIIPHLIEIDLNDDAAFLGSYYITRADTAISTNLTAIIKEKTYPFMVVGYAEDYNLAKNLAEKIQKHICRKRNRYPYDGEDLRYHTIEELKALTWTDYINEQKKEEHPPIEKTDTHYCCKIYNINQG
jgi:predicted nucleotidyltransferase component of viral defense system